MCKNRTCPVKSFTLGDHRIAAKGCMLTTRAAKWVCKQIGGGQTVIHLARELGCGWDAINNATRIYGEALLTADTKRLRHHCHWLGRDAVCEKGSLQAEAVVDDGVRRASPGYECRGIWATFNDWIPRRDESGQCRGEGCRHTQTTIAECPSVWTNHGGFSRVLPRQASIVVSISSSGLMEVLGSRSSDGSRRIWVRGLQLPTFQDASTGLKTRQWRRRVSLFAGWRKFSTAQVGRRPR
jgi:hypothetical protein